MLRRAKVDRVCVGGSVGLRRKTAVTKRIINTSGGTL